jgi:hypothetical protein
MDKENVVYLHNRLLLNHKKEWIPVIYRNMDGTGVHYVEWKKPERQIPHILTYVGKPMSQPCRNTQQNSGH